MSKVPFLQLCVVLLACALPAPGRAANADDLIHRIEMALGPKGSGSADAAQAWKQLTALGPDAMPAILAAMDEDKPILSNYLRPAVDAIGEKALQNGKPLPVAKLEQFLADKTKPPAARRLAYEWLARTDKKAPERLLPDMLHDPSAELRRDAVAQVLKDAQNRLDKKDDAGAKAAFQKALTGACDEDQVRTIVDELKKLGVTVDVAAHYGFVLHWHLAAPFDNKDGTGFGKAYAPEMGVDLKATYKGKDGDEVRWSPVTSDDPEGKVDLNLTLGKKKAVIAYGYAVIDLPEERTVQLRAGSFNALKMFVNGKQVFGRDEYHHGMRLDQHVGTATLKKGRNEVLLKICQNDQKEDWAQSWSFQVRLCDATGAAIRFKEVKP
jgi:hypothetical protein